MKTRWWWVVPALAVAGYAQTESPITREGRYWVQTVSGTASVQGAGQLRISIPGSITLSGAARPDIAYTLTRRVRADNEQRAREELARFTIKTARQGGWNTLIVDSPHRNSTSNDLRVTVPRSLKETQIESDGGSVEAHDLEGSLKANTGGGEMRIDRVDGDVTLNTGGGGVHLGSIKGAVRCTSGGGAVTADSLGSEARLSTGGGEIHVTQTGGPLRASTGGGNIRVDRSNGPVTASTGGGSIEVAQTSGSVTASTGAGPIKVRAARSVRCESASGPIQLQAVSGRLRVATGMGTILAQLTAGQSLEDSALSTGQGDITVFIPSNLAVTVQAVNNSPGTIVSDFPEIRPRTESHGGSAEAQGSLNGGGPLLKLTASGGTIYLRRQK